MLGRYFGRITARFRTGELNLTNSSHFYNLSRSATYHQLIDFKVWRLLLVLLDEAIQA